MNKRTPTMTIQQFLERHFALDLLLIKSFTYPDGITPKTDFTQVTTPHFIAIAKKLKIDPYIIAISVFRECGAKHKTDKELLVNKVMTKTADVQPPAVDLTNPSHARL